MPWQEGAETYDGAHELGAPVAEHRYCFTDYLFRGLVLVSFCLSTLGYSAYCGEFVAEAAIGLILGVPGVYYLGSALRKRGLRVVRCEQGLLHIRGRHLVAYPWAHIEAVWQRRARVIWFHFVPVRIPDRFVLRRDDGQRMALTEELAFVAELRAAVLRETAKHMLPRAVETLRWRGAVRFSKLEALPDSLVVGYDVLPWHAIQSVSDTGGKIRIRERGRWLSLAGGSSYRTPNLHVLLALIDHMVNQAEAEQRLWRGKRSRPGEQ